MLEYKYNYFYKITNNINGHYYYGIHSTNNLDDGYMGSGTLLNKAFDKYGIENFSKEIIKFFSTRLKCSEYESEIVDKELARNEECYNIRLGGDNQYVWFHTNESREQIREKMTPEDSKNNRVWVCKSGDVRYVLKRNLDEYLSNGFELGRKDYKPRKGCNGVRIGDVKKDKNNKNNKKNKDKIDKKTKAEIRHERGKLLREKQENIRKERIRIIIESGIDFSKFGWVSKVSSLINLPPQKVNVFMKKYMPEFYEKCFVRKKVVKV